VRLTDEHIIAYALAMDTYLPQSSCESCNKTTSYLEGYAGRHIFGPMRKHFRIQSRRKNKDLGTINATFFKADGTERPEILARNTLPALLFLPIFSEPGLFAGKAPGPIANFDPWAWHSGGLDAHIQSLYQEGEVRWVLQHDLDSLKFARMLAKIAHAVTVGWLGLDAFKPFLPELILGQTDNAGFYIGAAAPPSEPLPAQPYRKDTLHHLMTIVPMSAKGKPTVLAVSIRLFHHIGTPTYWAIVGEPTADTIKRLTVTTP
jgi:hypothetical protein